MFEVAVASFVAHYVLFGASFLLGPMIYGKPYREQDKIGRFKYHEKIVSAIHGSVSTYGAIMSLLEDVHTIELFPLAETMYEYGDAPPTRQFFLEVTLGYFVYDLSVYLIPPFHHTALDFTHHAVAIMAYLIGFWNKIGTFAMICLQSNEISTPFLHLSFFLEQYGLKASPLFMANRVIFASLFLVARVMFDSYIALGGVIAVTQIERPPLAPFAAVAFSMANLFLYVLVQYLWFYKIAVILHAKCTGKKRPAPPQPRGASKADKAQ